MSVHIRVHLRPGGPPPPPPGDGVAFPSPEIGFIAGPLVPIDDSPWPFYDENLITKGTEFGNDFPTDSAAGWDAASQAMYYDLGLVLYTAFYRSADPAFLTLARKVTDSWWLNPMIAEGTTDIDTASDAPRNVGIGGLMVRALDGRPEFWPWITEYVRRNVYLWLERQMDGSELYFGVRDGGYMLTYAAWLAKVHPDSAVRAEFTTKALAVAKDYYARLQHADGGWYWEFTPEWVPQGGDMWAAQPFMIGLMLEGMVAIHQLTGDTVVRASIIKAADWLYAKAFEKQAVTNVPGVYWRAMRYLVYRTNYTVNDRTTGEAYGQPGGNIRDQRQLNPDTIHAFGYAFRLTGDSKYLTQGDDIFAATFGKGQGPGADAYWSLVDYRPKEFNQGYRSSGKYLAWRAGQ